MQKNHEITKVSSFNPLTGKFFMNLPVQGGAAECDQARYHGVYSRLRQTKGCSFKVTEFPDFPKVNKNSNISRKYNIPKHDFIRNIKQHSI